MYSFQIWGLIRQSNGRYDELEIYYVIPLLIVIVPFVYLTRAKLFSKVRGDDLKSFNTCYNFKYLYHVHTLEVINVAQYVTS